MRGYGEDWSGLQAADAPPADAGFPPFPGMGQAAGSQQPLPQSGDGDKPKFSIDMLEMLMRDEKMQETMYQYLPENMRNKETFDWMLSNPEFRGQLQTMLEKQASVASPVHRCRSRWAMRDMLLGDLKLLHVMLCITARGIHWAVVGLVVGEKNKEIPIFSDDCYAGFCVLSVLTCCRARTWTLPCSSSCNQWTQKLCGLSWR